MINLESIEIKSVEDYSKLQEKLPEVYVNHVYACKWIEELKRRVGTRCTQLVVEFPYYDSEYLSSYYEFYSKKFQPFEKMSARIHFFRDDIYGGYISVRPISQYLNLSKSYLAPWLFTDKKIHLMISEFKVHLIGKTLYAKAFPWMHQQADFSICAHVAAWAVMKYFGNEHRNYRDVNIGEIVKNTPEATDRKFPSKGLNLQQISEIFRYYNTTPVLIKKKTGQEERFYRELLTYIESGIPVVAEMDNHTHAIAVIGHGEVEYDTLDVLKKRFIMNSELISTICVNDDNFLPYLEVRTKAEDIKKTDKYHIEDINFCVVPLYDRIHLEYTILYEKVMSYLRTNNLNLSDSSVVRMFLASANSFKEELITNPKVDEELRNIICRLEMPKFIWCVQISTPEEYKCGKVSASLLVDSTACDGDPEPWLLLHDSTQIIYRDEGGWYKREKNISVYDQYRHNLR